MTLNIDNYFKDFFNILKGCSVSDNGKHPIDTNEAIFFALTLIQQASFHNKKTMVIGNGGSSSIASHFVTDLNKNCGLRSITLNNAAMLTCLGNDFGYEFVFSKQIEYQATKGDVLFAISSSGQSANILNAVQVAKSYEVKVVTLSGFQPDNPLRSSGDINFYLPSKEYGFVEIGHALICHAIGDSYLHSKEKDAEHEKK